MYYTAVASPRVCCATIIIHILTAASSELARARLRFIIIVIVIIIIISMCDSVRQCSAVRQCEWQFVAVRTAVCSQCARHCVTVHLVVYVW
jgi:hypothetical protein